MKISAALLLAASLLLPLAAMPQGEATESGAATLVYTPAASDAGAFFLRLRMSEATACMTWRWNVTMRDTGEPMPYVFSAATGSSGFRADGRDVPFSVGGRDLSRGWIVSAQRSPQTGDGHLMVNASVGGNGVFHSYQETGYNQTSSSRFVAFSGAVCDVDCRSAGFQGGAPACGVVPRLDTVAPWLSLVGTARVSNATVKLDFWETYDHVAGKGTRGAARGELAFASESNRTFVRQLKDFEGPASYNGDPLRLGADPNAAGVLLEKRLRVERGLAGGFGVFDWSKPNVEALSYAGPDGVAGASSQSLPLSPAQLMTTFEGPPGDWTFRAHAYAAPAAYASLYLWGADIATG